MGLQAKCESGKIRHFTKADAQAALLRLLAESPEHPQRKARLKIYRCWRLCGAWHLGH